MVQQAVGHLGGLDVLVNAAGLWQRRHTGIHWRRGDLVPVGHQREGDHPDESGRLRRDEKYRRQHHQFRVLRSPDGQPDLSRLRRDQGRGAGVDTIRRPRLGRRQVTVNALAPAVQTPGADRLREFLGPDAGALIDQQLKTMIPLGGALGDPARDVGPMLVFLAGPGSHFITGQLLAVDGGLVMVGG